MVHYSRFFTFRKGGGVLEPNPLAKGGLSVLREAYILLRSGVAAVPVTSTAVIAPANHVEEVFSTWKLGLSRRYVTASRVTSRVGQTQSCMEFDSANRYFAGPSGRAI